MVGMAVSETRLAPAVSRSSVAQYGGPGRLDPYNPAHAFLFETAKSGLNGDALALFFGYEAAALDWLADYKMDDSILACRLEKVLEFTVEEEEAEEHYDKKSITTTEADTGWAL
jgi:hypothetical protein